MFLEGRYEADDDEPTVSEQGDWNQDGVFDSSDLVMAMKAGNTRWGDFSSPGHNGDNRSHWEWI